jgi:LysM repeat protein
MELWHRTALSLFTACLGVALVGCEPSDQNTADDEKEPHFVLGQNRVNAMDYAGAVEAFEESLEANPHSAAAHYQLAWIYENEETNPAAAIYHYQQYLKYDPTAPNAEVIAGRIDSCKRQLAADVMQLPSSPAAQQQLLLLADKNRQLQDEVDRWRAYYASQMAAAKAGAPPASIMPQTTATPVAQPVPPPVTRPRTHIVAAGETFAAIARKTGVNLNSLLAANPGLDPKRLRVGQIVSLPPP